MTRSAASRSSHHRSLECLEPYDDRDLVVVIETPKGSQNKFAFDPGLGTFVLKGVLPVGAAFPFDFGFVPSTLGEDGDPLDILLLMDSPAFPGCIVPSRLIGVVQAEQTEDGDTERNDRLLAVAAKSLTHRSVRKITDLNEDLIGQIEHFFTSFNAAKGKTFKPTGRFGVRRAKRIIEEGTERFKGGRGRRGR
jgi:inorganic pyrophosphatase